MSNRIKFLENNSIEALEFFSISDANLLLIQDLVNCSYKVSTGNKNVYLKVYHPNRYTTDEIKSEIMFLNYLYKQGFPCPNPLKGKKEQIIFEKKDNSEYGPIRIAAYSWIDGDKIQNEKNQNHYFKLGKLIGQLHGFSKDWSKPIKFTRKNFDIEYQLKNCYDLAIKNEQSSELINSLKLAIALWDKQVTSLNKDKDFFGLVHADPSFGNVLFNSGKPYLIDFDDMSYSFFAYDIAVVLAGAWGKGNYHENSTSLLKGYQIHRSISTIESTSISLLMTARAASIISWCIEQSQHHSWIEGQVERIVDYIKEAYS